MNCVINNFFRERKNIGLLNNQRRQMARSVNSLLQESGANTAGDLSKLNDNLGGKLTSLKAQYGLTDDKSVYESSSNITGVGSRLAQSIRDLRKNRYIFFVLYNN